MSGLYASAPVATTVSTTAAVLSVLNVTTMSPPVEITPTSTALVPNTTAHEVWLDDSDDGAHAVAEAREQAQVLNDIRITIDALDDMERRYGNTVGSSSHINKS